MSAKFPRYLLALGARVGESSSSRKTIPHIRGRVPGGREQFAVETRWPAEMRATGDRSMNRSIFRFAGSFGALGLFAALAVPCASGAAPRSGSNITKIDRNEAVASVSRSGGTIRGATAFRGSRVPGVAGGPITVTVSECALDGWDISNYDFTVNPPDGDKIGDAPTARGTFGKFVTGPASPPGPTGSL